VPGIRAAANSVATAPRTQTGPVRMTLRAASLSRAFFAARLADRFAPRIGEWHL
jgi:hypothetical protein